MNSFCGWVPFLFFGIYDICIFPLTPDHALGPPAHLNCVPRWKHSFAARLPERYLCVYVPLGCGELQLNLHLYDFFLPLWVPRVKYLGVGNIYHCYGASTSATATNSTRMKLKWPVRLGTHNKTKTFIISYEFLVAELATISRDMQLAKRAGNEAGREQELYRQWAKSGPNLITGWPAEWPKRKCLNLMT